jgi:hypothetical protein
MNLKTLKISSKFYVFFSGLSLGYVAVQSLINPQSTMDLVEVSLPNTNAVSSIRGIYGGVGLLILGTLLYFMKRDLLKALLFLVAFWYAYAISRVLTIIIDGPLGNFGKQWLVIESAMCVVGAALLVLLNKARK